MIKIVPYDPTWPLSYQREERRIRAALGERVLRLEHTGSTSVPGLAAKPIIDVTLEVASTAAEADYLPALEATGYVLRRREPWWYEHRLFIRPDVDVNLHVFSASCPETARMIAFRDRLRADAADRSLYERTKLELAAREWPSVQAYAEAKTAVITEILARAAGR